jgi:2'-5' RNA ligase
MAMVLEPQRTAILNFGNKLIREEDLYIVDDEFGREKETHVTILYGFVPDLSKSQVVQIIRDVKPFTITLTGVDTFKNEKEGFDVVKFSIESPILRQLNADAQKFPNQNDFPNYSPHMTIAYVKPNTFKETRKGLKIEIPISQICYSSSQHQKMYVNL